jgi:hypothetical protein
MNRINRLALGDDSYVSIHIILLLEERDGLADKCLVDPSRRGSVLHEISDRPNPQTVFFEAVCATTIVTDTLFLFCLCFAVQLSEWGHKVVEFDSWMS